MVGVSKHEEYKRQRRFSSIAPIVFGNTLHAHLESVRHLKLLVRAKIVKVIKVDLLFHQDDIEGITQKCAMALS
jgi:hypothetical protein